MNRQGGIILPALLVFMLVGIIALGLAESRLTSDIKARQHRQTIRALADARSALVGFALSYPLTHTGNPRLGLLPCPDLDNDGSSDTCGSQNAFSIGRFPFRTLGLPKMIDGSGNCLWYAVAGNYKNNPDPPGPLNWDTPGQFNLVSSGGMPLNDAGNGHQAAVAVVLAPSGPIGGQSRSGTSHPCPGGDDAAAELASYLESSIPAPGPLPVTISEGLFTGNANNDRIAWISAQDLGQQFSRTAFVNAHLQQMLDTAHDRLSVLNIDPESPLVDASGNLAVGKLPSAATLMIAPEATARIHDDWRSMTWYARCRDGTQCLGALLQTDPDNASALTYVTCRGILVFGGSRRLSGPLQSRLTTAQQADPSEYFEGTNVAALSTPTSGFSGLDKISLDHPDRDVISCIY
ncbi:type II secretion system protein [Cognatazoarcus halotolerans]|uniref:type II secretion system protein n=1 Tax=Cognatazoarcus halotolerans TaxID=2686016 RepID=UPI001356D561|nr:type II secretion system protein [Cognatazoarcus halotolerans]MBX3678613.1 type II secretion system protein [Rhodocyclaceae bacterium]MCB1899360.1 type II secretion system protein [Rhodocyclaceae bacterium]MCP5308552.1 type II secretion system protein [Zoogloeaceae bacterium]